MVRASGKTVAYRPVVNAPRKHRCDFVCHAATRRGGARRYCLVTPCRDESRFARRTLESVARQTIPPALWVIVDDGSSDATPQILNEYARRLPYVRIVRRKDRGFRKLGGGVVDAFYDGLAEVSLDEFDFICKFDLDQEPPPHYFERLVARMEREPRIGTASGKAWYRDKRGRRILERCGDENSVGMSKFYRVECFRQIGGFVRELMWDGIDGHRCRMLGWIAVSWPDEDLLVEHLRPMGTSDRGWWRGRWRHGAGQYFMGTTPPYLIASAIGRITHPPVVLGAVGMLCGYFASMLRRARRYEDPEFRSFLRRYQYRSLALGKANATRWLHERRAGRWRGTTRIEPAHRPGAGGPPAHPRPASIAPHVPSHA